MKEKYPLDRVKTSYEAPNADILKDILSKSKPGDNLKKILNPNLGMSIVIFLFYETPLWLSVSVYEYKHDNSIHHKNMQFLL